MRTIDAGRKVVTKSEFVTAWVDRAKELAFVLPFEQLEQLLLDVELAADIEFERIWNKQTDCKGA